VSRAVNDRLRRFIWCTAKHSRRPLLALGLLVAFLFAIVVCVSLLNRMPRAVTVSSVASSVADIIVDKPFKDLSIASAALWTFSRVAACVALSAIMGTLYGLVLFVFRRVRSAAVAINIFVRAIPITFLYGPLVLIMNPRDPLVPVWLASIPCVFIIAESIASQAQGLTPDRVSAMKGLVGSNVRALWTHFYFWEALVGLLTGLRIAIPYAGILVAVLEYVGAGASAVGVGRVVFQYDSGGEFPDVLIAVVILYGLVTTAAIWSVSSVIDWLVASRLG
jgi:ABC-type nitrate/sulfonate/bicarbonate transport system permease component